MAFDTLSDRDDASLLAAYAAGDHAAARALTLRHAPPLLRLGRRMLGNDAEAEDIVQETLLKLWTMAPRWRADGAKLSTWLYRVASNACTDRLRRRARLVPDEGLPEPADEAPSGEARLMAADRADALSAALSALPERQRLAITLRHMEECSNPEIAEIMELSVEAVESLLSRGRRALKAALAPQRAALGLAGGGTEP